MVKRTKKNKKMVDISKVKCATCHEYFEWNEAYKCVDTPGSIQYNPPGTGNYSPRVFCPNCGALILEWHITRIKNFDEWIWVGENATLNTRCSFPPSPHVGLWGRGILPQFVPFYDEYRLDIEKIIQFESKEKIKDKIEAEENHEWEKPLELFYKFGKEHEIEAAEELLQKAIAAGLPKRKYAEALDAIGGYYLQIEEDVDKAFKYYLSSIETDPFASWYAHYYLGIIFEAKGDKKRADQEYRNAQRVNTHLCLLADHERKMRSLIRKWAGKM